VRIPRKARGCLVSDPLLPARTRCSQRRPAQGTVLLCTGDRAEGPRAGTSFTGGHGRARARGSSAAQQGAWPRAQRCCLVPRLLLQVIPPGLWDLGLSGQPCPGRGAQLCQQPLGRAWPSPGRPRGAAGSVPGAWPSCRAPIPSAAMQDAFGGRARCRRGGGGSPESGRALHGCGSHGSRPRAAAGKGRAAGGKGGEPRAVAVPPLTHSPVETEICSQAPRCHLQPTPAPVARHSSPSAWRGAPCKHPLPGSTPRRSTRGSRGLPAAAGMAGLCSPRRRALLSPPRRGRTARRAGSPGTQQPPSPGSPRATFVREPPGRREQDPPVQTLPTFVGAAGQGSAGASPPPAQPTERAFRAGSGCSVSPLPAGAGPHSVGLAVSQMQRAR